MAKPFDAERYLTRRWAYGTAALIYYVRPGGSDTNDGLTPATAFATLERALHFMAISDVNLPVVIDVTGMTGANAISGNSVLNLGGNTLGGLSFDLDLAATSPNNFFSRQSHQIRSDLALVQGLTVTGSAFNATTGLLTLTVSDALVANALRGKFAVGSVLGEYGCIRSNTGGAGPNTIQVANIIGLTNPVGAYEPGATLRFGDAANFFEQAIYLNALSDWSLQGLFIESNGPKATAINIWPNAPVYLTLCDVAGMSVRSGSGQVVIDGSYIHDQTFAQDGGSISAAQSYFRSLSFLCHGSGDAGLNEWIGVMFEGCTPFGGGNVESNCSFEVQNAQFDGALTNAVQALFGVSRLRNTIIQNSGASGVVARNPVALTLDNVQGTGNVGYGLEAYYGAIVRNAGATAITGTLNDVVVGAVGAATWAGTPITDADQLVRVGA